MQARSQTKKDTTVGNSESLRKNESSSDSKKGLVSASEFRERMSDRTHSLVTNPECSNYLVHK